MVGKIVSSTLLHGLENASDTTNKVGPTVSRRGYPTWKEPHFEKAAVFFFFFFSF